MAHIEFKDFCDLVQSLGGEVEGIPKEWKNVNVNFGKTAKGSKFFFDSKSKVNSISIVDYWGANEIHVGESSKLTGGIKIGFNCKLLIGDFVSFTGNPMFHISESTCVRIGSDCMFGSNVSFYSHDYHPIFDSGTRKRVNHSRDISIGSHVWCGNNSVILKGVIMGDGSILGAYSVCSANIPSNSVAVGNPAVVKKHGVHWTRDSFNTTKPFGIDEY